MISKKRNSGNENGKNYFNLATYINLNNPGQANLIDKKDDQGCTIILKFGTNKQKAVYIVSDNPY